MEFIDIHNLEKRLNEIKQDFQSKKPFRYTSFENFFNPQAAEAILREYPSIEEGAWDGTTYINQKNKFQKTKFDKDSLFDKVFRELNSTVFTNWLSRVSGIQELKGDPELFGGGLHQSVKGAFLNVHVDYNLHPTTRQHRRLNVLVYMNKDWREEYEGHVELWDLTGEKQVLLDSIAPLFNRCVIFETNEISFHGHPRPLNTPRGVSRKSLATYYYSEERPGNEIAPEHNTIYVNTEGVGGHVKKLSSVAKALLERINKPK